MRCSPAAREEGIGLVFRRRTSMVLVLVRTEGQSLVCRLLIKAYALGMRKGVGWYLNTRKEHVAFTFKRATS